MSFALSVSNPTDGILRLDGVEYVPSNGITDPKQVEAFAATLEPGSRFMFNYPLDGSVLDKRNRATKLIKNDVAALNRATKIYQKHGVRVITYQLIGRGDGQPSREWTLSASYMLDLIKDGIDEVGVGCYFGNNEWLPGGTPTWDNFERSFEMLSVASVLSGGRRVTAVLNAYVNGEPPQPPVPTNTNGMLLARCVRHDYDTLLWGWVNDAHTRDTAVTLNEFYANAIK